MTKIKVQLRLFFRNCRTTCAVGSQNCKRRQIARIEIARFLKHNEVCVGRKSEVEKDEEIPNM